MTAGNDPRYSAIERTYTELKAQLAAGKLTREQFESELQKFMLQDEKGRYWMMGAESGKWYVYEGQTWQQADPPTAGTASPTDPAPTVSEPSSPTRDDAQPMTSVTPPQTAQPATPASANADETSAGFTPPQPSVSEAGRKAGDPETQGSFIPPQSPGAADTSKTAPADTSTRDSALTMPSFTPPPQEKTARDSAMTMPSFVPPAAPDADSAARNAAMTMPSFVPPVPNASRMDNAATMASFVPPKATATNAAAATAGQTRTGGRRISPAIVAGCLLAAICLLGVVALAIAVSSRFGSSTSTPAAIVVSGTPSIEPTTASATATPAASTATAAPAATDTLEPTPAPRQVASPTQAPTRAPVATAPVIVAATNTPTNVPPTETPTFTPPPPPPPTDTPTQIPFRSPTPSQEFPVTFAYLGYASWGNPDNEDCTHFNDKDPRRQLKWETTITNRTGTMVTPNEWSLPVALNNEGGSVRVCSYTPPNVPPGQAGKTTFAAYVRLNQYVARITQKIRNTTYVRCLDAALKEVGC